MIAALVQIDQEIAKERALQAGPPLRTGREAEDIFGFDGDQERGD